MKFVEVNVKRIVGMLSAVGILLSLVTSSQATVKQSVPAKAALVTEASGDVLYSKYPNARLAPASTVKLMTAMVTLDNLRPEELVRISRNASRVKTIPPGICPDEEMTIADLLHLALMKSINSAAVALAEATAGTEDAFAVLMNRKAHDLGARDTLFANASGLPKGVQYSTVHDLTLIMRAALSYPLIRDILATKAYTVRTAAGREIFLENSNQLLWQEETLIVGKTGYTGNARHCFVGAVETGRGLVFTAVLGARSRNSLWRAASMLADMGAHPERAEAFESFSKSRAPRRPVAVRNKPLTVNARQNSGIAEIQRSRLQGIF